MSAQLKEMTMTAAQRAESNRSFKQKRVWNMQEEFSRAEAFVEVAMKGGEKPDVSKRTSGRGAIQGNTFINRKQVPSVLHVQCAFIEPGDRKYMHWHENAETIWVIVEGEGEFYGGLTGEDIYPVKAGDIAHALPGQWHGMGNTGKVRLKYLSIEGPQPIGGTFDKTTVAE